MSLDTVDDYRLPLRQWLCHQVDLKKYTGLEWVDDKKTLVKIPWIQQNHPGWEDTYKLFEAWAIHRDTYTLPPDYKKLKGNFRCALRKSESFQEIKPDFSTSENHGAEFKVYRVLAAEEVQERRKEQQLKKRPHTPENNKRGEKNRKKMRVTDDIITKVAETIIPLGMESGMIKDHQITSTAPCDNDHRAALARLNNQPGKSSWSGDSHVGAWVPRGTTPGTQWIQIHFSRPSTITGVMTQGRPRGFKQWVKTYTLQFSDDAITWDDIKGFSGHPKVFVGNKDGCTPVTNVLPKPIVTNYLRLVPLDYNGRPALRMEVLGVSDTLPMPCSSSPTSKAPAVPSCMPQLKLPIPPLAVSTAGTDGGLQTEAIARTLSLIPPTFLQQNLMSPQSLNYLLQNTDHVDMFYLSMADEARKLPPVARLQLQSQIVTLTVDALKRYGKLSSPLPPPL